MKKRVTLKEFITRSNIRHANLYGYEKVILTGLKDKVEIFCIECQRYFWQTPKDHLSGRGCRPCGYKRTTEKLTLTKEGFLQKAKSIHGDKYGYENAIYINALQKLEIFCKICSKPFWQKPANHTWDKGQGCPECGIKKQAKSISLTEKEFIAKSKSIHGNEYGYDKIVYINNKTQLEIFCKECKIYFWQTPDTHLGKHGCPECGFKKSGKKALTQMEFIKQAIDVHGNEYGYGRMKFINTREKIEILCKECKKYFWQVANDHKNGSGCPECNIGQHGVRSCSYSEKTKKEKCFFYYLKINMNGDIFFKIGLAKEINPRMKRIKRETNANIEILYILNSERYPLAKLEERILEDMKAFRYVPPIRFGGWTECFAMDILGLDKGA